MKLSMKATIWSPYLVGAGIGLLLVATILFFNKPLGVTSGITHIAAFFVHFNSPLFNWQTLFLIGIFLGGACSAYLSSFKPEKLPTLWSKNFGYSLPKRYFFSFIGGILILVGARVAGGCTTGHAIAGGAQLSVAGWLFILCIAVSGIISAHLIYRK